MEKKKILLIDDDAEFTELIKMRLEDKGAYDVRVLSESKGVLEAVHLFAPDVILLDLLMPNTGGLEICDMLNADPVGLKTPVIVVSGLDKDADRFKAYKLGITDYLTKPIEAKDLLTAIEKAVRMRSDEE